MKTSDFDYDLPKKFISLEPLKPRDASRLMVLDKKQRKILHKRFFDLPDLLDQNCVLVFNDSAVIPARILFKIGAVKCEILLLKKIRQNIWECLVRPGRKFKKENKIKIRPRIIAEILNVFENGSRKIKFFDTKVSACGGLISSACVAFGNGVVDKIGVTPFPPYLKGTRASANDYQTIYAHYAGSAAAPTAGLHFTKRLFKQLKARGIETVFTTLHVGLGTFQPVKTERLKDHKMHSEYFTLGRAEADALNKAKQAGKKIIAVGTTSVRVLESCADSRGRLCSRTGETDIFIYPGYKWKFIDGMITNFHLPKSTLIMLVSAFAGKNFIFRAYKTAQKHNYRFYSFGDAMLII